MGKPLTDLMPTLYAALDIVSREIVGFVPAVAVNAAPTTAALGEDIQIPKTTTAEAEDIVPGKPSDNGDPDLDYLKMTIQKSRMVAVKWNGEQQLGVSNSGTYNAILAGQFAQSMRTLANEVDADLAALYVGASRAHGTPGVTPFKDGIADAPMTRKILADNGAPLTDLQMVVDTTIGAYLRSNAQLTKANEAGSDATLRRGELLQLSGFSIRESAQIRTHVAGSITGDALVNNADGYGRGASVIAVDGMSAVNLKAGDLISFGGGSKYVLKQASNATPLTIAAPGLMSAVADDTAVSVVGNYVPSLAFDRNALQLVARAPAMPQGGDEADDVTTITDPVSGISFQVAVYRGYRQVRYEVGLAWGVKLIKPEHVAILFS